MTYRSDLTCQTYLSEGKEILRHYYILEAADKRYRYRKVSRRLIKPQSAYNINIGVKA